ncbi:MAG: XRE family transcriptional regulator [Planctomycetota bacterium]|nr:MAG: XRE family transcriptional regulator [Planctomycetota bacterium]REJ92086.1 MAG: XRE family transcriptional regulator [Planctomycetota bacterium]REK28622.1 MAG: XRE family transcriptional regulator [Planctomycetota bacterium]REK39236.1 MAG: XRE family transcriptional regulator [Planctomycetota bacterium]
MDDKTNEKRTQIASRLRLAREAAGLTQGQVAKKLGLHRPTVSEIEAGRRRVSADELATMAELYGIDVGWLAEGPDQAKGESDKIILAARQLSKLKDRDLERLMDLIRMLRGSGGGDEPE